MTKINVEATIFVSEINGKEAEFRENHIKVRNHWNCSDSVVLEGVFPENTQSITVSRFHLLAALAAVSHSG